MIRVAPTDLSAKAVALCRAQWLGDLRNLSTKVLTIQDEERRRIARDLHDGVGQTLTGALMALSQAISCPEPLPTGCQSGLREAEDLLQQAVREVRTVSHLLHPPLLDESGLLSAVQWYAEGFSKRSSVRVTLELDEQTERFGQDVETGLFRIVQEALKCASPFRSGSRPHQNDVYPGTFNVEYTGRR